LLHHPQTSYIIVKAGLLVALPLPCVVETMRPQPLSGLVGMPAFICGLARIRGASIPVVDLPLLLTGVADIHTERFITIRTNDWQIALAVESVIDIREISPATLDALPPLLGTTPAKYVEAVGALDDGLLLLLRTANIIPPELWEALRSPLAGDEE